MNDLEHALRDALSARSTLVRPDPHAYPNVVARHERRRALRWLKPVGAAAATVLVIGLAAVAASAGKDRIPEPTGIGASRAIAIQNDRAVVFDPERIDAPTITTLREEGDVTAVAAVGDGRLFFFASRFASECKSSLYRIDARTLATSKVAGVSLDGLVVSLAITRDERMLVYSTIGVACGTRSAVHVRDLLTGRERVWNGGARLLGDGNVILDLTVSPDGRYIAYMAHHLGFGHLDTTREGPLPEPTIEEITRTREERCHARAAAYLPTGELAVAMACTGFRGENRALVGTYDPLTRKAGRKLFDLPPGFNPDRLDFDGSGRHAFITSSTQRDQSFAIFRWDEGATARKVPDQIPSLSDPTW